MSIVIFIIVLAVLILVHEFGHFLIAKLNNIKVEEFGLGFPPKIFGYQPEGSETEYTLNWLPFGGFVQIFGENYMEDGDIAENERSFINQSASVQAAVLSAGVIFNVIFAWLLFSVGFMIGMPTAVTDANASQVQNPQLVVTDVLEESPAADAGLRVGDTITGITNDTTLNESQLTPERLQEFIRTHEENQLAVDIQRSDTEETYTLTPAADLVDGKPGIGIAMSMVGVQQLAPHTALYEGVLFTGTKLKQVTVGLAEFFSRAFTGQANFSQVAGPVGIAGLVDEATALGLVNLLSFVALISLNLAVLNLLPVPALDGGRLVFVAIEKVKGSRIKPQIANVVNTVGFALLILLMIVITYHDILRLFG